MIAWFKECLSVRREAVELIQTHGPDKAWAIVYAQSRALDGLPGEHALRVRRRVEKITGIEIGPDTATRYLE